MTVISLSEAQANLTSLVRGLIPGDEIVITDNDRAIARLTLADEIAEPSIRVSNAQLLEAAKKNLPPTEWYEEEEEDLF